MGISLFWFVNFFLKLINYSCVQWPTGLLDLGCMHACIWIPSETLEPVFHRVFICRLIGKEDTLLRKVNMKSRQSQQSQGCNWMQLPN